MNYKAEGSHPLKFFFLKFFAKLLVSIQINDVVVQMFLHKLSLQLLISHFVHPFLQNENSFNGAM